MEAHFDLYSLWNLTPPTGILRYYIYVVTGYALSRYRDDRIPANHPTFHRYVINAVSGLRPSTSGLSQLIMV